MKYDNILTIIEEKMERKTLGEVLNEMEMAVYISTHPIEDKDESTKVGITEDFSEFDLLEHINELVGFDTGSYMLYSPKKGWTKKQTRRGHIIKDKAKAGWHNGSVKGGYGDYDKFLLPERLRKDAIRDMKAQFEDIGYTTPDSEEADGICSLWNIYGEKISREFRRLREHGYYRYEDWFVEERLTEVEDIADEIWDGFKSMQSDFHETIQNLYIDEGTAWELRVVDNFMTCLYEMLFSAEKTAYTYIKDGIDRKINSKIEKLEEEKNKLTYRQMRTPW